jgi:hypothetical protein
MILTAQAAGVEQPDPALLARRDEILLAFESKTGEDVLKSRSRFRIQYALAGAYESLSSRALLCGFCLTPIKA